MCVNLGSTLKDLQTLVLDLRDYSYRQIQNTSITQELLDKQLALDAERMECLNLKSLTIYGLCSGPEYWGKQEHKERLENLFAPALASGKPRLVDEQDWVDW